MSTVNLLEQASEHVKKINKLMGQVEDFEAVLNDINTNDSKVCLHNGKTTIFVDLVLNQNIMDGLKVTLLEAIEAERKKTEAELLQLINKKAEPEIPKEEPKEEKSELTVELVKEYYHKRGLSLEETAKELGIPKSTLYTFISKNGLRKPSKKEKEIFLDTKVQSKRVCP